MSPEDIKAVRLAMEHTQQELAALLGLHAMTISKWERGVAHPGPYHIALLAAFQRSAGSRPNVGRCAREALPVKRAPYALYVMLGGAFGEAEEATCSQRS